MSWWNPLSWGGDVAGDVVDKIEDAIGTVAEKIIDDPKIILAPATALLGGVASYHAAKSLGRAAGEELAGTIVEAQNEGE